MEEADAAAMELYRSHVTETGYDAPRTYEELLLFVRLSGAPVSCNDESPPGFSGIQVGNWIHVTGRDDLTDEDRKRILAHEWCHWLRRSTGHTSTRLYSRATTPRDHEEDVARAFEALFHHAGYVSWATFREGITCDDAGICVDEILADDAGDYTDEERQQLRSAIKAFVEQNRATAG